MFVLYDLLVALVTWTVLVPWQLLHRRRDLRERLGSVDSESAPCVVIHAVSVGEVNAAAPLIRKLQARGARVVVTTSNDAGREAAQRLDGVDRVLLLPWDRRRAIARWLRRLRAAAVVVVETELWPGLFRACHDRAVPLFIVSGRIYPKDVARYRLARPFFRAVLALPSTIFVQDEVERARFLGIGADEARVVTGGNLKIDAALDAVVLAPARERERMIVAGSTHAPEEELLLAAFAAWRKAVPELKLVIAPRDPSRARALQSGDAVVIDRFGELPSLYARAEIAFLGGTLAPMGGHNFVEAVAAGSAVVMGPHLEHVESLVRPFADCVSIVSGPDALHDECLRLLRDDDTRRARAAAATRVLAELPRCADAYAAAILGAS